MANSSQSDLSNLRLAVLIDADNVDTDPAELINWVAPTYVTE